MPEQCMFLTNSRMGYNYVWLNLAAVFPTSFIHYLSKLYVHGHGCAKNKAKQVSKPCLPASPPSRLSTDWLTKKFPFTHCEVQSGVKLLGVKNYYFSPSLLIWDPCKVRQCLMECSTLLHSVLQNNMFHSASSSSFFLFLPEQSSVILLLSVKRKLNTRSLSMIGRLSSWSALRSSSLLALSAADSVYHLIWWRCRSPVVGRLVRSSSSSSPPGLKAPLQWNCSPQQPSSLSFSGGPR